MGSQMNPGVLTSIKTILDNAHRQGRHILFEHEVYEVLSFLKLQTPKHLFVRQSRDINQKMLSLFGSKKLVLKAIAKDLTHKQTVGGVVIVYKDLEFIRYSFDKMLSSLTTKGYAVEGLLLVEHIAYSKDLGNEILLGFRESAAFGPVISFSKGGSDAEHFATHFSAPNLILAPIGRSWASALLESTKIYKKYASEGKAGVVSSIVDAEVKLSHLSVCFSNFFKNDAAYVIKEFEINPFVVNPDGDLIALDGFASFDKKEPQFIDLTLQPKETLRPFFEPKGVAVVGISASDPSKPGNTIFRNLMRMGRRDIFGVNIKGGQLIVSGQTFNLYRSVLKIEGSLELAIVSVPAQATLTVVKECAARGIKALILLSGGFSEVSKSREVEAQILEIARRHHMRIMGPNCLGTIYAGNTHSPGINTFFVSEEKFCINLEKDQNVALVSQSGALGITEIYNLRHAISPKVVVSYGNQLDVGPSDLIQYFQEDPAVDVIGCYIEGFNKGAGRTFFDVTAKSRKPIIVYKAGRTEAGKLATQSHTASIAGEYEVAKAAMKQAGLIVADKMLDHGEFIKTFALLKDFEVVGNRVAIIVNAGYEKTYAADNLGKLRMARFEDEIHQKLREILPAFVNIEPFLDLTPMADDAMIQECIETVLQSSEVDALFISIVPLGAVNLTSDVEIERHNQHLAARIVASVHRYKKPVAVSVNVASGADALYNKFGQILDEGGVPTFLSADRAMACMNAFIRYRLSEKYSALSDRLQ
jgi:acyl-CoA synthetase (NDP forming)